jgi:hypothetical protein
LPQLYYAYHKPPFYTYTPLPEEMQRTMRGADPLRK